MWKERYMHLKHYIFSPAENHWYGFNCVQMMNGDFKRGRSIGRKLIHLYHKGEQNWVQPKKKKKGKQNWETTTHRGDWICIQYKYWGFKA